MVYSLKGRKKEKARRCKESRKDVGEEAKVEGEEAKKTEGGLQRGGKFPKY